MATLPLYTYNSSFLILNSSMLLLHSLILGSLVGYCCGSIPSAYLLTRWKAGLDLRREGSRNIGARNAFEVTGNRSIGRWVLAADILKALLPVLVFELLGLSQPLLVLLPALVLGHCYPVWLLFHGGRGLATSAGALLLVNPAAVIAWLVLYAIFQRIREDVHFSSVMASGGALLLLLLLPFRVIEATTFSMSGLEHEAPQLTLSIGIIVLVILSRHIEPMVQRVRKRRV